MTKANREHTAHDIRVEENALMDFQFAIIDALNERNLTQVEFAEMLGVSRARVSQMLSSTANPTIKLVGRALDVLGLKANYLLLPPEDFKESLPAKSQAKDHTSTGETCRWRAFQLSQVEILWHQPEREGANSNVYDVAEAA